MTLALKRPGIQLIGLVAVVMVAFAANSVLNRAALDGTETGPASFAALRLAAGAVVLGLLVSVQSGPSGQSGAQSLRLRRAALPGVLTLGLYMLGFSFAYISLPSGTGALILFGGVQLTMFAGAALAREALPPLRIAGAALAFGGLVWLMLPGADRPDLAGAILMSLAAIGWGVFSLIGRRGGAPLATMATSFLWCTPLALLAWSLRPDGLDLHGALLAILSGGVTSGLGYALWYRVLPQIAASRAAVAQLTVPILAALGGALVLSEPLTLRFALATLLVLGGVFLALRAQ